MLFRNYVSFTCGCLLFIVFSNLVLHYYFRNIDYSILSKMPSGNVQMLVTREHRGVSENTQMSAKRVQKAGSENGQTTESREQNSGSDSIAVLDLRNMVGSDSRKISLTTPKGVVRTDKISLEMKPRGKKFPLTYSLVESSHSPQRLRERIKTFPHDSEIVKFLKSQDDRLMSEREYCSEKNKASNSNSIPKWPQFDSSFVVDTEYGITFCPIYKAASSTWLVNLLKMKGAQSDNLKGKLQKEVSKVFQRVASKTVSQVLTGTTKFMIVRHPLHRLISCYRDKFEGAPKFYYYDLYGENMVRMFRSSVRGIDQNQASKMMAAVKNRVRVQAAYRNQISLDANPFALPIGPTFEEFTKYVVSSSRDDVHWKPFYIHCSMCHIEYDFILHFENLYSDSKLFVEYLNMTNVIKTGWENPTSDGTTTDGVVCRYFNQINSDLFEKIISKYKIDFELFHYDTSSYEKCVKDFKS